MGQIRLPRRAHPLGCSPGAPAGFPAGNGQWFRRVPGKRTHTNTHMEDVTAMRQFHHVGIPTSTKRANETYLEGAKLYITDPEASPYRIEWLRYEPGSPLPQRLQTEPHIAFMVEDLEAAMKGKEVLIPPFVPMPGLVVGFVIEDGALIEFMQKTN